MPKSKKGMKSIKCPKVYEALKNRRGFTKTKAAKISNSMARKGQCP